MLLRSYTELVVEGVMPELFHIIPVGDYTTFNGIIEGEDASLALSFISNITVFICRTHATWTTNN
jgi:hypothetical protein